MSSRELQCDGKGKGSGDNNNSECVVAAGNSQQQRHSICCCCPEEGEYLEHYLDALYQALQDMGGTELTEDDRKVRFHDPDDSSDVYVEVTWAGVEFMLHHVVRPMQAVVGEDAVWCDFGCGVGRLCAQLCLTHSTHNVIGIELSENRYLRAVAAWARLCPTHAQPRYTLLQGNFVTVNELPFAVTTTSSLPLAATRVWLQRTTVAFLASVTFSYAVMARLLRLLLTLPRVQVILTLQPFPELLLQQAVEEVGGGGSSSVSDGGRLKGAAVPTASVQLVRETSVECTWGVHPLYVYTLQRG